MTSIDEDAEENEPLYTIAGNVNCVILCIGTMEFLTKLKIEAQHAAVIPFDFACIQKKWVS